MDAFGAVLKRKERLGGNPPLRASGLFEFPRILNIGSPVSENASYRKFAPFLRYKLICVYAH